MNQSSTRVQTNAHTLAQARPPIDPGMDYRMQTQLLLALPQHETTETHASSEIRLRCGNFRTRVRVSTPSDRQNLDPGCCYMSTGTVSGYNRCDENFFSLSRSPIKSILVPLAQIKKPCLFGFINFPSVLGRSSPAAWAMTRFCATHLKLLLSNQVFFFRAQSGIRAGVEGSRGQIEPEGDQSLEKIPVAGLPG